MIKRNLFCHPTMILSTIGSIMIGGQTVMFDIMDNGLNAKNMYLLLCQVSLTFGTGVTIHSTDERTYTPRALPGRNFVDLNKNGTQDEGEPFTDSPNVSFNADDVW